jgi:glycosyltransferase involved in cell wall biosynthesis
MRILILGNMANDGYSVAKGLWKMKEDVDLAVNSSDFGMALPEWEDGYISSENIDPYNVHMSDIQNTLAFHKRIHYFDFLNKIPRKQCLVNKVKSRINLIKMMREYDIVESHVPYMIYSQFSGIPYVVYDAGWIRYLPYQNNFKTKLARRSYRRAKSIIITNPDTLGISDSLPFLHKEDIHFSPFAIDSEKYKHYNVEELRARYVGEEDLLLFSPSRQMWREKGNDKMLRAYAQFSKIFPNSKFIMVEWSVDEENSKNLASSLGISNKIIWIKPVPKNQLIQYYNAADIVLDQFVLGSWGTSTPEAMCCGKPVLMFYERDYVVRAFGEEVGEPPILNSYSEEEICINLLKIAKDKDVRNNIGKKSREWIIKTHSPELVAMKHLEILNNASSR